MLFETDVFIKRYSEIRRWGGWCDALTQNTCLPSGLLCSIEDPPQHVNVCLACSLSDYCNLCGYIPMYVTDFI